MLHLRPQRNTRHYEGKAPRPNHNTLPPKQSPGRGALLLATLISLILCPLTLGSPHAQSATWTTLATTSGTLVPGSLCTTDGKDLTCNQPLSGLMSPDRITSGTAGVFVSNTGIINFRTGGVTTGYFDTSGLLVVPGVSTTGMISTTNLYLQPTYTHPYYVPATKFAAIYSGGDLNNSFILATNGAYTFFGARNNTMALSTVRDAPGSPDDVVIQHANLTSTITSLVLKGTSGWVAVGSGRWIDPSASLHVSGTTRITSWTAINANVTATAPLDVYGTVSATRFVGDGSGLFNIAGASADRIVSGTTSMLAISNTGYISVTQSGVNTAYFHPSLGLVTVGVSSTGGISGTTGYFSGKVGIGTGYPSTSLHIASTAGGGIAIFGTGGPSTSQFISINNRSMFGFDANTGNSVLQASSGRGISLNVSGSFGSNTAVTIASNAYVGIGSTSPTAPLEVSGTVSTTDVRFARNATPPTGKCASAADEGRMVMTPEGPYVCLLR